LTLSGPINGLKDLDMFVVLRVAMMVFAAMVGVSEAEARRPADGSMHQDWWMSSMQGAPETVSASRPERSSRAARSSRPSRSSDGEGARSERGSSGVGPRPGAWCGWYMRTRHGGGPEYNLAWNWSKYGSPGSPQVGAIVVWRHHVGEITGQASNGQWIVLSGNDSGRVRERARSISGAVIRV
jgi:hypothetical protein